MNFKDFCIEIRSLVSNLKELKLDVFQKAMIDYFISECSTTLNFYMFFTKLNKIVKERENNLSLLIEKEKHILQKNIKEINLEK